MHSNDVLHCLLMYEQSRRTGCCLKTTGTPTTIDKSPSIGVLLVMGVHLEYINNSTPLPEHSYSAETRKQLHDCLHAMFNCTKASFLTIADIRINTSTNHQLPFIRLANIAMNSIRHHDGVQYELERFRNVRLQWMTFKRQSQICFFS